MDTRTVTFILMNFLDRYKDLPDIQTPRLLLRKLSLEDAAAMFQYASKPRVSEYCSWPCHKNLHDSEGFLQFWVPGYDCGEIRDWAWVCKSTSKMIGTGGLVKFDEASGTAEIGYVLNPDYWGQGYATEAVKAIVEWAFQADNLYRIIAHCMVQNNASTRVLQKCGFQQDACLRQMFRKRGMAVDVLQFSLLRRDVQGEDLQLRVLGADDFPRMTEITLHAFQYDPATGKAIEDIIPPESKYLKGLLNAPKGHGIAHGLILDGVLVAYVLYTPAPQAGLESLRTWSLSIMGVDTLVQKSGYGTRLLQWSTEQMRSHADFIFTVGHPKFYPRSGYLPLHHWKASLDLPGAPPDVCMGITLSKEVPAGTLLRFPFDIH